MSARSLLLAVTVIAVVSDCMLAPFYPQFFAEAFGVVDPRHIGLYIAASCLVVMVACPLWASLARRVPTLHLLVYTQLAACGLSGLCAWTGSLGLFWLLSLGMFAMKGSYLLVYPTIMELEDKERHVATIGLLSVIVHLGGISGAVLAGFLLQLFAPRDIFLVMAAADLVQALVCLHLAVRARNAPRPAAEARAPGSPAAFILKLGAVMLLLYFSAFLTRPFFALYWESVSGVESAVASGAVFAIPAGMALLALWYDRLRPASGSVVERILPAIGIALAGCLLQAIPHEAAVLAGRCVYGWGIVRAMVRLDVLLFQRSAPGAYATDFSKVHVFQQLGALVASTAAGSLVAARGLEAPLLAGGLGMVLTAGLYAGLFAALTRTARKVAMTS